MAKRPTKQKPAAKRESEAERQQREYRAALTRANRHAAAVARLVRQLDRAIVRNDRVLIELRGVIERRLAWAIDAEHERAQAPVAARELQHT